MIHRNGLYWLRYGQESGLYVSETHLLVHGSCEWGHTARDLLLKDCGCGIVMIRCGSESGQSVARLCNIARRLDMVRRVWNLITRSR